MYVVLIILVLVVPLNKKIMLSVELQQATELLDALKKSSSEVVPHLFISYALYRCRFEKKEIFVQLFRDFVDVGYNPLRRMTAFERVMVENIVANL